MVVLPREILVLVVAPVAILALAFFMTRTSFGLAVRASASNADTARVYGISVKRTSTIVWTIAGGVRGGHRDPHRAAARDHAGQHRRGGRGRDRPVAAAARARGRADRPDAIAADDDRRRDRRRRVRAHRAGQRRRAQPVDRRPVPLRRRARARRVPDPQSRATRPAGRSRPRSSRSPNGCDRFGTSAGSRSSASPCCSGSWPWSRCSCRGGRRSSCGRRSSSTRSIALSITPLAGWAGQLSLGQFAFVGLGALTMVVLRAGLDIPVPFDLWDMHFEMAWLPAAIVRDARRRRRRARRSASRRCAREACSSR